MSNSERNYQKEFENAPLLKERINGIRHDHKGKFLAFGEIIDNGFVVRFFRLVVLFSF